MKIFDLPGGIHPAYRKELSSEAAIRPLPLPKRVYIPLQQHVGALSVPIVAVGEAVKKGQVLCVRQGSFSATQHAPTSGTVVAIEPYTAPHASGLPQETIVIETDGRDEWGELPAPIADPFAAEPQEIIDRVAISGIVGLGGAIFPAAIKLNMGQQYKLDTLLINGAECEPYLTCDDRLMREYAAEVIDGARIMARALGVKRIIVAVEENKPQAIAALKEAAGAHPEISVTGVPIRYPVGYAQHLTKIVTGRETPAEHRNAEVGVVTHNVATARAVHHAVRFGRPLISRVVTVTGGAVRQPSNLEVPIGTPVSDLVEFCGGFSETPKYLVMGGPMMGQPLPALEAPIVKGSAGILALSAAEVVEAKERPCIRCGSCMDVCPVGLSPMEMAALIKKDKLEAAAKIFVGDCIGCGSCAWACPSHIPLVQYFNYANGMLYDEDRQRRKNERTKTLSEAHAERMERLERERKEARAGKTAAAPQTTEVQA
ncbi:MAG TPA: electron transport complex subunit RsxC [Rhodocyclaceae bacterium]|nr:electron transport complex subunit RsxC [Rhodocyclaceae bacterium]